MKAVELAVRLANPTPYYEPANSPFHARIWVAAEERAHGWRGNTTDLQPNGVDARLLLFYPWDCHAIRG